MSTLLTIDQRALHVYVAVENLARGRSVNEIAEEVGVSRFVAARMIRRARDLGLIEVRATIDEPVDVELSARLARAFDLRCALVVLAPSPQETEVRTAIAKVAARFFAEHVHEDDVVGLTPGRTLVALSRHVATLPWLEVVQLTGVGAPRLEDGVEAIVNLGRASGGATFPLYAPIFAEPRETRLFTGHPANQRTLRRFDHLTTAFLTIGGWPDSSLLARQLDSAGALPRLEGAGVVAEIGTVLVNSDGGVVDALGERIIGISERQLRRVGLRVAVGGGPGKEDALGPILRSGIPDVVITDARSARRALGER